jgi:BirA family biotin operon repressor/biotin-[acetyl-CoA-carboxylase] ligase
MILTNKKFILLKEVESTNNYANQLLMSKAAEHGTVVLAQHQKKGRGQQGNSWESEPGLNMLASLILFPANLPVTKQFHLSKTASLALIDFLETETDSVSIKWPNDIYIQNKKIAGILIENSVIGSYLSTSIIGIGLNLNQEKFISGAPNPVSLKQITGKNYDIETVAEKITEHLNKWYKLLEDRRHKDIDTAYLNHLFRINQWAVFAKNGNNFEAKITGIGEFGQLILEDKNGTLTEYMFKEVEFII